ncbi:major facilitator superfamily domain-containing protein [Lipomyces tetrasporus]|uniref:Major facilitator superfamily domain-containing protein n=1 Tax=Lipomyces tetrasporus TaxID=54092 RepID=A0AAD7VTI0_9ASCO|nr:major facilitator superfamily domain-containing protein [Lipomyces tetrasporus]KAJ8100180.1 major facilitator superfamily domain-containing protein [Lipomyces tetrasporus]
MSTSTIYFRTTPAASCLRTICGGRVLPHPPIPMEDKEDYLVTWDGVNDVANPRNFPMTAKILISIQIGLLTFIVTVTSSIYSGGMQGVMKAYDCSSAVAALGLSLFVLGYGLGPVVWGPLSEIPAIGRNLVYIPTLVVFVCLQVPTALSGNLGTLLSMRFLGGFFGSPVLAVGAGSMVDIFEPKHLPYALGIWGSMAALGPLLGPLIGGFAFENHDWRWTIWAISWMSGFLLFVVFFFLPETSADKLLREKAARLCKETGNSKWMSESEKAGPLVIADAVRIYLLRPFALLLLEPIVLLLSLYLALLYGLEYLFFEAFPIVFSGIYGWKPGPTGLGFFGVFVGVYVGLAFQILFIRYRYKRMWARLGDEPPLEEWLWTILFGSFCVPISMFWFGWSARAEIHWIVPIIGSVPFGFALEVFFQGISTYLAMAYTKHAASAMAANDFLRCAFAAAFPIFTPAMYYNLGVGWASSIPGFISLALIPIPFILYGYGARIRSWSKYAD